MSPVCTVGLTAACDHVRLERESWWSRTWKIGAVFTISIIASLLLYLDEHRQHVTSNPISCC